jgi:glycosyltransferase involved in cell wall biosynthesis
VGVKGKDMNNPKLSVVIPAYNHEKYVGEAIQSVLDQTFQDFELIIINDGSRDNTETEVLKFKDERIRYFSQENRGLSAALNRGIELSRGEYFNFLPSDDAFLPEKLEVQLDTFEESEDIGVVFSYPLIVDGEGKEVKDDPIVDWFTVPFETKEQIFPALFERDFLSAPSALMRMECFQRVGFFDESLKTAQDYDMWMRILKYYDLKLIKRPLLKYRWHGANLTYQATSKTELERAKVLLKAYKNLSIEDIFPTLRHRKDAFAYAEACEKLASFIEKSGIPALTPISQIYKDKRNSLISSGVDFSEPRKQEIEERFEPKLSRRNDRKINLLLEAPSLDKGGMEEVVYSIATRLDSDLFHPVVVCIERGGHTADRMKREGISVEILGRAKEKEYLEILDRYQIDLVNSHFSFFGPAIAHRNRIPTVSVLHNIYSWYSGSLLGEFRIADQSISKYIAVSKQVASFFKYRFNIDESRMRVIPDGINVERFSKEDILEKRSFTDLGIDEEDFIFLHVGALTPAKMHNLLVAAMKEISRIYSKIKLISIGPELDTEYSHFIQKKIEELHLGQHLKLIGFVEDLSPYYQFANAFLLPSLIEGWGIVTLEAMYHGLPLILTKVGGAEELIEDQDIGILIENCCQEIFQITGSDLDYYSHLDSPKNAPELIEAMLNLYRNQKEWKEKAQKGRTKVVSRYTWGQIIPIYEKEFIALALEGKWKREYPLERVIRDHKRRLDEKVEKLREQSEEISGLKRRLDEQTKEIGERLNSMSTEFQQQFNSIGHQLEYILLRLSFTERFKARLFKLLKRIHKLVPKRMREKYRYSYQRFFFNKVFPDKERFEQPLPSPAPSHVLIEEEINRFLDSVRKSNSKKLFVIYTTDPYVESRGQRSTWLVKEFSRRGLPVVFFYWRWDQKEEIVTSPDSRVFSVPIDTFSKIERQLFSFSSDQLKKIFLIEFPDSFLFERVNMANVHSFVTVYDCVDDWEGFAKAGQAIWYDSAVERYLIRNANLVIATNPFLAEKLKEKGAAYVPIIPNGVDLEWLEQKQWMTKSLQRGTLTIGYFGHLTSSWFDWDLLLRTASKRRDWVFHIIGYGEPSGLKLPGNIRFWGKVEHQELPSYACNWDVAIIPFREGRLTQAVDPIKLYEYLYLGLPVVATNMQQLREIPGVFPCSCGDFEETLILAKNTPFNRREVERFVQNNAWDKRVDQILAEIDRVDLSRDILKGIE